MLENQVELSRGQWESLINGNTPNQVLAPPTETTWLCLLPNM